ncbi:MAG: hypothetical protein ONB48_15240 [candidate division KSB1 bacterium]|nr:hypothetical protein [candidate division KSB1 bacterium]MDZ7273408.1 hypothetical protein [candidate division KSB1 bacterium]MDZ7286999.1 hypothetical protein [candidate division KSB1 bacterium]MDZ7299648.1 hypothetical protein [candidate division KSB1 bacterium]MDZ7309305.1 hypothetical protein [candidate division KSB1 bacterium]
MLLKRVFKPPIIQAWTDLLREKGVRAFVREKGWKILAAVFLFYLIRDSILYILVPVLITQGFICSN